MTFLKEEYRKQEKINGVIYDMSPSPSYQHGIIDGNIYHAIKTGLKDSLCLVFMENLDYKYHPEENDDYVVPDIMIICDKTKLDGKRCNGAPDFIIEIISPGNPADDYIRKLYYYQKFGVREYWIVDPQRKSVTVNFFEKNILNVPYTFDSIIKVSIYEDLYIDFSDISGFLNT